MRLGAVTHFEQGWSLSWYEEATAISTASFRDGISWSKIETAKGVYNFSDPSLNWIRRLTADQADVTLLFGRLANPLYESGNTINTEAGRTAFANFVVATLKAFPGVTRIEIGNEFNSDDFVTGALKSDFSKRDDAYAAVLATLDSKLNAAGLDVDIVGGAAHSIPVDWFASLKTLGAFEHMDAVAIHPYTTPPEQFEDQIAILREAMGDKQLPIHATEFGQAFTNLDDAAPYLAKMVSVMAAAGIDHAGWYAFAKQKWFPNMELYDPASDALTPAGKAFAFFEELLARGSVAKVAVDDFTYVYTFGDKAAVVWGEQRTLALAPGVAAYDLSGNRITQFDGQISPDEPIVLISETPLTLHQSYDFGATGIVGDSYHQFDGTNAKVGSAAGFEGPWSYYSLSGTGKLSALQTMGGGGRTGEAWTPYIGSPWLRPLMITAGSLSPVDFAGGNDPAQRYATVERFTATQTQTVSIIGHWDVKDTSADGVTVTIKLNNTVLADKVVYNPANGHVLDLQLDGIALRAGDKLDFITGSNQNTAGGDATARSIRIVDLSVSTAALVPAAALSATIGEADVALTTPTVPTLPESYDWRLVAKDDFVGEIGGTGRVVGTAKGIQVITVLDEAGTVAFDSSFKAGGDRIVLAGDAANWHAMRMGSDVVLTDGDTVVTIPVGVKGTAIEFADGVRPLINEGGFHLGDQAVNDALSRVEAAPTLTALLPAGNPDAQASLYITGGGHASAGGKLRIIGTQQAEDLFLTYGKITLDGSFKSGHDIIGLDGAAGDFTVQRAGSKAVLTSPDIEVILPVGTEGTTIGFADGDRTLINDKAHHSFALGDQDFGSAAMALTFA